MRFASRSIYWLLLIAVFCNTLFVPMSLALDSEAPSTEETTVLPEEAGEDLDEMEDLLTESSTDSESSPSEEETPPIKTAMGSEDGSEASSSVYDTGATRLTPEVDELTGALTYSYPLDLPPGRASLTPEISLEYNSLDESNNSFVGYGWSLNIPYIERLNKNGVNQLYTSEDFSSSLSGELVEVSEDTYMARNEKGDFWIYEIHRNTDSYSDGLYDFYWTATDKSGTVYLFGHYDAYRLDNGEDYDDGDYKVYRWMLKEIRDLNGNFIDFNYHKNQGEIYPSTISYTGNGSNAESSPDGDFVIYFNRERSDHEIKNYDAGFETKNNSQIDSITIEAFGEELRNYDLSYASGDNGYRVLLGSISVTAQGTDGTETTLPATEFSYQSTEKGWLEETDWDWSYLFDWSHGNTFLDANGDGLIDVRTGDISYSDIVYGPNELPSSNYAIFLNTGEGWSYDTSLWEMPVWAVDDPEEGGYPYGFLSFPDLTGDGYLDAMGIAMEEGYCEHYCWLENLKTGWYETSSFTYPEFELAGDETIHPTEILDVNGDGLVDFVYMYNSYGGPSFDPAIDTLYSVYLNTGSTWERDTEWTMPYWTDGSSSVGYQYNSSIMGSFLDVNGDQLPDYVISSGERLQDERRYSQVFLNTGSSWENVDWNLPTYSDNGIRTYDVDDERATFIELNGDGLVDFVVMDGTDMSDKYKVFINTGSGWEEDEYWDIPTVPTSSNGWRLGYYNCTLADVNGDHLPDLLGISSDLMVYLNTGTDWVLDSQWTFPEEMDSSRYRYWADGGLDSEFRPFIDVNNDGLVDALLLERDGTYAEGSYLFINQGAPADRLSTISLSSGVSTEVTYKMQPIEDTNPTEHTQQIYVVETITQNDGLGMSATLTYEYQEGKYYPHDGYSRSFVGFGRVIITDHEGNQKMIYSHQGDESQEDEGEYEDAYAKVGLPYRVEWYDKMGALYKVEIQKWMETEHQSGAFFAYLARKTTLYYEGDSEHKDSAEEYSYDSHGNIKTLVYYGEVKANEDGSFKDKTTLDEKFTVTTSYATDSAGVIKNKIKDEKITDSSGTVISRKRYYYDGSTTYGTVSVGNVTRAYDWLDLPTSTWIYTGYTYNSYGLVTALRNPRGYTTSYAYDDAALYPETITNPKGYTVQLGYDYSSGQVTSRTDENGSTTSYSYDGFGRPLTITVPDPTSGAPTLLSTTLYDDDSLPSSSTTTSTVGGVTSEQVTYYDGFGRSIQTNTLGEDGVYITLDLWYDENGNVRMQSLPYESSSSVFGRDDSQYAIESHYDALNRPLTVTDPNGSTHYSYADWEVTVTDPKGIAKSFHYSAAGQLLKVEEENEGSTFSTSYGYDPLGRLLSLTDAHGNERHFTYDSLGRKLSEEDLHDPSETDFGTWTYTYDYHGNLSTRTDPKGQVITWAYDQLDRMKYEDWDSSTSTRDVLYSYDTGTRGKMRLYKISSNSGDQSVLTNTYDYLGNPTKEYYYFKKPGLTTYYSYLFQSTYDLLSRPTKIVYPSSVLTVNYSYNEGGQIEKVTQGSSSLSDVVSDFDYSPAGQVERISYGNGTVTTNSYDPAQAYRLTQKTTSGIYNDGTSVVTGNIQDLTYVYDAVGNITSIVDKSILPTAKTISYTYDDLNRLLTASTTGLPGGDYIESYTYDELGNLTSKSDLGTLLYEGTGASGTNPHAVTNVAGTAYSYDANGNLTSNGTASYTWDKQNRLTAGGAKTFAYDYAGQRYKITDSSTGTELYSYYMGNYGELRNGTSTSAGTPTYYLFAGPQRLGFHEGTETEGMTTVHQDHLGGTAVTTDSSGLVSQIYDYTPYGSELQNTQLSSTDAVHSFTDKELDDALGLYYFEARWYDPKIGRFVSKDPLDKISYAYAANNPIKLIDPTGLYVVETGDLEEGDTKEGIVQIVNEAYGITTDWETIAEVSYIDPNKSIDDLLSSEDSNDHFLAVGTNHTKDITTILDSLNTGIAEAGLNIWQLIEYANNFGQGDLKNWGDGSFGTGESGRYWSYVYHGKLIRQDAPGNIHLGYQAGAYDVPEWATRVFGNITNKQSGSFNFFQTDDSYDSRMVQWGYNMGTIPWIDADHYNP